MDSSQLQPTRRDVLSSALLAGVALSLSASATDQPRYAFGSVFHDQSRTGQRTADDSGIAGVLVSNGRDVVRTASDGSWRLPVRPGDTVFMIKPPQWEPPRGANGLPAFSYCLGTIEFSGERPELSPITAAHRETHGPIDFALRPVHEPSKFDALLITDTQPQSERELDYLRDGVLAALAGSPVAFAINHGDVVFDDLSLYPRYLRLLAATGLTWHHCPGNHDMDGDRDGMQCAFRTWNRVFGPSHHAFQFGPAMFIVLNNVEPLPAGNLTGSGHSYRGRIGHDQLTFLANLLAHVPRDQLVVLSMHIPLTSYESPNDPAETTIDRDALLTLLSGRPHTLSFSGHTHTTEHHYLGPAHGFAGPGLHHHHVLTAACGSWWSGPFDQYGRPFSDSRDGTPKGFHILSVDGNRYTTRFVSAGAPGGPGARVLVTSRGTRDGSAPDWAVCSVPDVAQSILIANVFDGGPRTKVSYEIEGVTPAPVPMQRQSMCDPFIVDMYRQHKRDLKPWVEAGASSHIWRASLPKSLIQNAYRLKVLVEDEYGRSESISAVLEVSA